MHWSPVPLRPTACGPRKGLEPAAAHLGRAIASGVSSVPRGDKIILSVFAPHPSPPLRLTRHTQCLSCVISCTMAARSPRTTTTNLIKISPPISPRPATTEVKPRPRMSPSTLLLSSSSSLILWALGPQPWPSAAALKSFPFLKSNQPVILPRTGSPAPSPHSHPLTGKLSPSRNKSRKINGLDPTVLDFYRAPPAIITPRTPPSTRTPSIFVTQPRLPPLSYLPPPSESPPKSLMPVMSILRSTLTNCGLWRGSPMMSVMFRWLDLPRPWIKYLPGSQILRPLASQSTPPAGSMFYQSWPG